MKAPAREMHRLPPQVKKKAAIRAFSAFIYRAHKEVSPVGRSRPNFLPSRPVFPRPVMLRLVSSEASLLSRTNRLKVITTQELNTAVAVVQQKVNTRAAA